MADLPLPPTLVPPLVDGVAHVLVEGTIAGRQYEVIVQGLLGPPYTLVFTAVADRQLVLLAELRAGDRVRVEYVLDPSIQSHELVVDAWYAPLPGVDPRPAPGLPPMIDPRAEAIEVFGCFPFAWVRITIGGAQPTLGVAGPDGSVVLQTGPIAPVGLVEAQQWIGATTPGLPAALVNWSALSLAPDRALSPEPQDLTCEAWAGQTTVRVVGAMPGSIVTVTGQVSGATGSGPAGHRWAEVALSGPLVADEELRLEQAFPAQGLAWWNIGDVQVAADPPPPRIAAPLWAGTREVLVEGLVPGCWIKIQLGEPDPNDAFIFLPTVTYGWRPATFEALQQLQDALVEGQLVRAVRTLDEGVTEQASESVVVEVLPADARDPVIVPNPFDCGRAVGVLSVRGAAVRVFESVVGGADAFRGYGRVTSEVHHVHVPTVALRGGTSLYAVQDLPGQQAESALVPVVAQGLPHTPRIWTPFAAGHTEVGLSGVNPGSVVWVMSPSAQGWRLQGWTVASDPVVQVRVAPMPDEAAVVAAYLCDESDPSVATLPSPDPGQPGPWAVAEAYADGGYPPGQLYWPVDPVTGVVDPSAVLPLVLIGRGRAPGAATPNQLPESFLGYAWLARHLASHGLVVFSLDPRGANWFNNYLTYVPASEDFVTAADWLRGGASKLPDKALYEVLTATSPLIVMGHSTGGLAAAKAVADASLQGLALPVAGLVLFSPHEALVEAVYGPPAEGSIPAPTYLVTGTYDYLINSYAYPQIALRPGGVALIARAEHNGYNTDWIEWVVRTEEAGVNSGEEWPADVLPMETQQAIARDLVTAFVLGLVDDPSWHRWLAPPAGTEVVRANQVHRQYRGLLGPERRSGGKWLQGGPIVVELFGDPDPQLLPLGPAGLALTDINDLGLPNILTPNSPIVATHLTSNPPSFDLGLDLAAPAPQFDTQVAGGTVHPFRAIEATDMLRLVAVAVPEGTNQAIALAPNPPPQDFLVSVYDTGGETSSVRVGAIVDRVPVVRTLPRDAQRTAIVTVHPTTTIDVPVDALVAAMPSLRPRRTEDIALSDWSSSTSPVWVSGIEAVSW